MEDFVIYAIDFEGSLQTGILEYGIVGISVQHGIFLTETNLCKNKTSIPSTESHCHHLSENELTTQVDFSHYISRFLSFRSKGFFCAHNASFENTWIDTYFLYKKFFKKNSYVLNDLIHFFQLDDVLEQLGRKFCPPDRKNFHCALFDALACSLLLLNFIRNIKSNHVSISWLLEQSTPIDISREIRQPQLWD